MAMRTASDMGTRQISSSIDKYLREFAEKNEITYRDAVEKHIRLARIIMTSENGYVITNINTGQQVDVLLV